MTRRTRRTSRRALVTTIGAAIVITAAVPLSAHASAGTFSYNARGTGHSITNPAPGVCLRTPGATNARNETNGPVGLYNDSSCGEVIHIIKPNEAFFGDFNSAKDTS